MAKVLEGPGMGLMKKWGISVPQYVVVSSVDELKKLADGNNWLSKATLVVKAHEALGSRFKLGLVKVDLDLRGAQAAAKEMLGRHVGSITVTQVIVSEMVPHKEEYYAAVKSTRDGADGASREQKVHDELRAAKICPVKWRAAHVGLERNVWLLCQQKANDRFVPVAAGNIKCV